jgi:hypothetical protein
MLIYGGVLTFLITVMSCMPGSGSDILSTSLMATALYLAFAAGVTMVVKAISGDGKDWNKLNIATTAICMIVPVLMAQQEWNDHNRSHKTTAPTWLRIIWKAVLPMPLFSLLVTMILTRFGMHRR